MFKMFGSVRLVQEVTRSNDSTTTSDSSVIDSESSMQDPSLTSSQTFNDTNTHLSKETNNSNISSDTVNNTTNTDSRNPTTNTTDIAMDTLTKEIDLPIQTKESQQQQQQQKKHGQHEQQQIYIQSQRIQEPTSTVQQQQSTTQQYPTWTATTTNQTIPISFGSLNSPKLSPYTSCDIKTISNDIPSLMTTTANVNNTCSPTVPNLKITPTHSRKNSKYTIRHHRNRQSPIHSPSSPSTAISHLASQPNNRKPTTTTTIITTTTNRGLVLEEERQKSKSQKLLCLWPLPAVTRYTILITLFISALNFLHILNLSCSAPSFVIYRLDLKNLILSPFLFDWTLPSLVLFGWNFLILGLFEESLSHMVGSTRRFTQLLLFLFFVVSGLRTLLGFLFSKSTGWAFPSLFFSNSIHECSQGLSPFLFALLVVQSLSIDDKYILMYGQEESNHKITIRKVSLQLMMCLANYIPGNILWWSVSGIVTGFLAAVVLQVLLAREKRNDSLKVKDVREFITLERYRRTPLWRLLWVSMKHSLFVVGFTLLLLLFCNSYYIREFRVTPAELGAISQDRNLFTFVFMTAPRRGDPAFLSRTVESYLANWPEYPADNSPYSRIQAVVYTHFSNHTQFDVAKKHFSNTVKGQRYLKWIQEEGEGWNQRLHMSKALDLVRETYQSTYYALMEDDFPVCGNKEWHEIENVIYKAEKNVPNHCGVFVGTGGSGLFLKPKIARLTAKLLMQYQDMPPDIIIQKCLRGELPECSMCTDALVTSKTLLMYHIGYNTSTSHDRVYKKDEFQCGWRHPFNGDPSVITL